MAESQCTCGNFNPETEAEKFFDSHINPEYFYNEKQVKGRRLYDDKPIVGGNGQNLIPDRILYPTHKAYSDGWIYGPIGIEIKKSGIKLGPVFAQVLEQRQSIYRSEYLHGARVMPLLFAIFPADKIMNNLGSISVTQSILSCSYKSYNKCLKFYAGNIGVLSIGKNGFEVNREWKPNTTKGHRGS